jgi:2-polyprenyl-3-methyl-5-hydroxy-6-metoxy-1,4-benzoquinol methylase
MVENAELRVRQSYEEWHSRYSVEAASDTHWHRMIRANLSFDRDLAGKNLLEIGCGLGGFSCWLAGQSRRPRQIVAADFSITAVRKGESYAQSTGLSGIAWQVADIQAIAHPDCSFDTVISCETIEHVPQPRRALAELSRVLKPGGRLFLTTPNYLGTLGLYRLYLPLRGRKFTEEGQPINNFLLLPLTRKWVRQAGLRVVRTISVGHYLPFPGRPPIEMPLFNRGGVLTRWFGHHSLIVAERPA